MARNYSNKNVGKLKVYLQQVKQNDNQSSKKVTK
jgi:hypothetical protein